MTTGIARIGLFAVALILAIPAPTAAGPGSGTDPDDVVSRLDLKTLSHADDGSGRVSGVGRERRPPVDGDGEHDDVPSRHGVHLGAERGGRLRTSGHPPQAGPDPGAARRSFCHNS